MFLRGAARAGLAQAFKTQSNRARLFSNNVRRNVQSEVPNVGQNSKGWTFNSPNLSQYNAQIGSVVSIGLRAAVVWNFAMLIFESTFYPYDLVDLITFKKVE